MGNGELTKYFSEEMIQKPGQAQSVRWASEFGLSATWPYTCEKKILCEKKSIENCIVFLVYIPRGYSG